LPRPRGNELFGVLKATDDIVRQMRAAAETAMNNAYCRYSNFSVGAAVLSEDGKIFAGCNVENASYGLTICAERNAIFQAVAAGAISKDRKLKAVVVVTSKDELTPPCGACRQVIYEFCEQADADIFIFGKRKSGEFKILALLPRAFGPKDLGK
jgi:cytidine deaminase